MARLIRADKSRLPMANVVGLVIKEGEPTFDNGEECGAGFIFAYLRR
jgi:hypothetical protein